MGDEDCEECVDRQGALDDALDTITELKNERAELLGTIESLERRIKDAVWELTNG